MQNLKSMLLWLPSRRYASCLTQHKFLIQREFLSKHKSTQSNSWKKYNAYIWVQARSYPNVISIIYDVYRRHWTTKSNYSLARVQNKELATGIKINYDHKSNKKKPLSHAIKGFLLPCSVFRRFEPRFAWPGQLFSFAVCRNETAKN